MSNGVKVAAVILLFALIGTILFFSFDFWKSESDPSADPGQVACTQEAKMCPDGSYVGRTGPSCAFAACPTVSQNEDSWETMFDRASGLTFRYPAKLPTEFISTVDWPPKIKISNQPFICVESGLEIAQMGKTEKRTVGGDEYCVTTKTEGAAGSVYTNYTYIVQKDGKAIVFTFTLRATQCANYSDPQKTACEKERASFDIDNIVDRMAKSIVFGDTEK